MSSEFLRLKAKLEEYQKTNGKKHYLHDKFLEFNSRLDYQRKQLEEIKELYAAEKRRLLERLRGLCNERSELIAQAKELIKKHHIEQEDL